MTTNGSNDIRRDRDKPAELEHDTIWHDARHWLGLQVRFIAVHPLIGGGALLILVGGVILEHGMLVRGLVATGMMTDALVKHGRVSVATAAWALVWATGLLLAGSLLGWFGRFAYQFLWRAHFTGRLMRAWFAGDLYYHVEREDRVGNPEQRIQEDLYWIGYWTVWLIPFLIGALTSGTYAWVLIWQMSFPLSLAPLGIPLTIPYALTTTCLAAGLLRVLGAHFSGRRITRLEIIRRRVDADFRRGLLNIREFGESIAFQRGAPREERRAFGLFDRVRTNWWQLTGASMILYGVNGLTSSLSRLLPPLVCIAPILSGQMTIGKLVVATSTFTLAMQLISVFADEYSVIAQLRASVARVRLLESELGRKFETGPVPQETADLIGIADLAISLPNGDPLLKIDKLRVCKGQRLAIGGRSGSGKSTLLKVLAGLWPHASGQLAIPAQANVQFLPQRPYLPDGTLAELLTYPDDPHGFEPQQLIDALRQVGMPSLEAQLNREAHWRKLLSPGEQQRIAAARAILRCPDFLIVDEPTSALDAASEIEVYRALETSLPKAAIIIVAHSPQLLSMHANQLQVREGTLETAPEVDRADENVRGRNI